MVYQTRETASSSAPAVPPPASEPGAGEHRDWKLGQLALILAFIQHVTYQELYVRVNEVAALGTRTRLRSTSRRQTISRTADCSCRA
jgi:hypothetical protein